MRTDDAIRLIADSYAEELAERHIFIDMAQANSLLESNYLHILFDVDSALLKNGDEWRLFKVNVLLRLDYLNEGVIEQILDAYDVF